MDKFITVLEIVAKNIVARDCLEFSYQQVGKSKIVTDADSGAPEDVVLHMQEEITVPIQRIVREGEDTYFAVHPEVWEALLLMENPKTLEGVIEERNYYRYCYKGVSAHRSKLIHDLATIKIASVWTRVKWLFTGVT
jgi:hypothetical protein